MDYSKLKFFNVKYSLFSEYYKFKLNKLLDTGFSELPSYELHDNTLIYGLISDNEIIACMSLLDSFTLKGILEENKNDEMNGYSKKGDNGLFIYNLIVNNNYRRQKLGEILIRNLMKETTAKYLHCQVKKDNEPSFNLFFKCGFQIEDEMIDRENRVVCVMSRNI